MTVCECGTTFEVIPDHRGVIRTTRRFCSRRCQMASWKRRQRGPDSKYPTHPCETCGVAIATIGTDQQRRFCSKSCAGFARRTPFSGAIPAPDFGHWFAGITDGEGSFNIKKNGAISLYPAFYLNLRDDDSTTIESIQRGLGFGVIREVPARDGHRRQLRYEVATIATCSALCTVLRAYPLRSKKARDFEVWARAVNESLKPRPEHDRMIELHHELISVRRYPD